MSLVSEIVRQTFIGNGSTTEFAIPFEIIEDDSDEVVVYLRDETDTSNILQSLQVEGVDYTLTGANPPSVPFAVTVDMTIAPTTDQKLIIIRNLALQQLVDYLNNSEFPAETHELTVDKVMAAVQQINEITRRGIVQRTSTQTLDIILEEPVASKLLGWNEDADRVISVDPDTVLPFATQGSDTILNSQAAPLAITGWTIDAIQFSSACYFVEITRSTTNFVNGFVYLRRKNGAWELERGLFTGDADGVTLSLTEALGIAQVKYISDGLGAGQIKFQKVGFA